jgi:hypothetical protein
MITEGFDTQEVTPMVYLQASIKLYPGKLPDFIKLLNTLLPLVGKHGWKLVGSYGHTVGRLNSVTDLWEVPDSNAVANLLADPEFAKYAPQIHEIVEDEVLAILNRLPIG